MQDVSLQKRWTAVTEIGIYRTYENAVKELFIQRKQSWWQTIPQVPSIQQSVLNRAVASHRLDLKSTFVRLLDRR